MLMTPQCAIAQGQINFPRGGAYETCLDTAFGKWALAQAELQVNEDPAAQNVDDAAVGVWMRTTLDDCRKTTSRGDAVSEEVFARHVSRWREHVFDLASSIRRRGQSD